MLMPTEFHCYLVQKTQWNAVFHPAKLASGANYPVGWVQMPHSVRGVGGAEGAWGKGKNGVRLGGGGDEAVSPRCAVSTLVLLWPQGQSFYRAETCPHLDLPSCSFFFKNYCYLFLHLPECSFGAHFKLGATHYNHRCPLVARKEIYKYIYKIKQKAQSDVDINKTHLWGFLNNS